MSPKDALQAVTRHENLPADAMEALITHIMQGEVAPPLIGALLAALRTKGETVEEITGAARALRKFATRLPLARLPHLVETAGTGGDALHTFNISTAASIVAAAGGAQVSKHCGRAVSSTSGSGDVLEALGLHLSDDPQRVAASIEQLGVGFVFAPHFHQATRHVAPIRKELGIRTIFNLLGPLTNPVEAPYQTTGVWSMDLVVPQARVLQQLGVRHAMVFHSEDGLDEISMSAPTQVAELKDGAIREFVFHPRDAGLPLHPLTAIQVEDVHASKTMICAALNDGVPAARDIIAANAGATLYVSGVVHSLKEGVVLALRTIENGGAQAKLVELQKFWSPQHGQN